MFRIRNHLRITILARFASIFAAHLGHPSNVQVQSKNHHKRGRLICILGAFASRPFLHIWPRIIYSALSVPPFLPSPVPSVCIVLPPNLGPSSWLALSLSWVLSCVYPLTFLPPPPPTLFLLGGSSRHSASFAIRDRRQVRAISSRVNVVVDVDADAPIDPRSLILHSKPFFGNGGRETLTFCTLHLHLCSDGPGISEKGDVAMTCLLSVLTKA